MTKVVYLSFNSITEPLVKSQVLSYLQILMNKGYDFILLTAEEQGLRLKEKKYYSKLKSIGIIWIPIYKGKLGLLGQIFNMKRELNKLSEVALVHARSYFSGVVAYLVFRSEKIPYIYDIRGFWVDEKVYKGRLKAGSMVYKLLKWIDKKIYLKAAGIVSLTKKAKNIISDFKIFDNNKPLVTVIPTCVNIENFKPLGKPKENVVYLGSVGQGYMGSVIFKIFSLIQKHYPSVKITLISLSQETLINKLAQENSVELSKIEYLSLNHEQVAQVLGKCTFGLSFIKPHYSKKASCATKTGEYLACGMPVLCNSGIGDMDEILSSNVSVFCDNYSNESLLEAVKGILTLASKKSVKEVCQDFSRSYFSLFKGVDKYNNLYKKILELEK